MVLSRAERRGFATRQQFLKTGFCPLGKLWTDRELDIVRRHYPDYAEIERRLPHRTPSAVRDAACRLMITRHKHVWTAESYRRLRELARQGHSQTSIQKLMRVSDTSLRDALKRLGIVKPKRAPQQAKDPLVHAIRQRGFEFNLSPNDLYKTLRAPFWAGSKIQGKGLWRALRLLDGTLVNRSQGKRIVWND